LRLLTAAGLVLAAPAASVAHPPDDEAVRILSAEIRAEPASAALLVRRAELLRRTGERVRAEADLVEALRLDPGLPDAWRERARLRLESGRPAEALAAAQACVDLAPGDAAGWVVRSRACAALGRADEAATDLRRAIAVHPQPGPELYREWAERLAAPGSAGVGAAIAALDEGQERLGILATLQWPAIEQEMARGRPDAALARLDTLLPWYGRREAWLAARGDLLERAGRFLEAQAAYTEAWEALAALPAAHRDDPAVERLRVRLREAMRAPEAGR